MDILDELIFRRNELKADLEQLSVEYDLEIDDDGKLPILSEILELRMSLTNLQNEIIDLQSSKLAMLKEDQAISFAESKLRAKNVNLEVGKSR
jgi:hypothetical protein